MPRARRYLLAGVPQHIVQRGIDRQAVFFEDVDYESFLGLMAASAESYRVSVHAYCLMTNHYHLLVTPHERMSIPRFMRYRSGSYVRHANIRYGRTGTLWDGRYRASLVDEEGYFLVCHRYIELNPVRAGMVKIPGRYRWSSYPRNAWGAEDRCVTPHSMYRALGRCEASRQAAYRGLFEGVLVDELVDEVRVALRHNHVLGNERFKDQVQAMLARKLGPGRPGRPREKDEAGFPSQEQRKLPFRG